MRRLYDMPTQAKGHHLPMKSTVKVGKRNRIKSCPTTPYGFLTHSLNLSRRRGVVSPILSNTSGPLSLWVDFGDRRLLGSVRQPVSRLFFAGIADYK